MINGQAPGADLSLGWRREGQSLEVALRARAPVGAGPVRVYAALVEDGLTSRVTAGENEGATLHHDRVTRLWLGPFNVPAEGLDWTGRVPLPAGSDPARLAWVAFAQNQKGEVAQALLAPACEAAGG
jgi:hypothetical protein